jgi:hypothetical protein
MTNQPTYTAFSALDLLATGPLTELIPALKAAFDRGDPVPVLIFEDQTGRQVDFDLRGSLEEALARALPPAPRSGPGRPKLGVVGREISLLPRHWEWLEQQPNGASAALRRLVDQARAEDQGESQARMKIEAAGRFMSGIAGNLPGYEEASRALYARDRARLEEEMAGWPGDIRYHVLYLAGDSLTAAEPALA